VFRKRIFQNGHGLFFWNVIYVLSHLIPNLSFPLLVLNHVHENAEKKKGGWSAVIFKNSEVNFVNSYKCRVQKKKCMDPIRNAPQITSI